jgi:L-fuconolactonase
VRAQLKAFVDHPRLCGIRHVVQDEPDNSFMLREDFQRGIATLIELDLIYDILIVARQLPAAVALVGAFPDGRFVLDHIAKPDIKVGALSPWSENIRQLAAFPNVACKVSGMVTEADWKSWTSLDFRPYLDVVFDAFGPERLMIGSDWPVCTLAGAYGEVIDIVLDYIERLGPDERARILGGTAAAFYKLEE